MVGGELAAQAYELASGRWVLENGIPLQLCDLAIFLCAYGLIRRSTRAFEFAYFWGLSGTLQGLITPSLNHEFPDYRCLRFFLAHSGIIISVVYLAFGLGLRPSKKSIWRVFWVTNVYVMFVGVLNAMLGTNYLFLCEKPMSPSLVDYMGPWPYYLVGLEVATLLSFILYYSPFFVVDRLKRAPH
jgi:hypothetical integral membrane protein (TIGR02206 family)